MELTRFGGRFTTYEPRCRAGFSYGRTRLDFHQSQANKDDLIGVVMGDDSASGPNEDRPQDKPLTASDVP